MRWGVEKAWMGRCGGWGIRRSTKRKRERERERERNRTGTKREEGRRV
jgi:hypothetical protein